MSANALHAFLSIMGDGRLPERMQTGFDLLMKKEAPERYLSAAQEAGLLTAVRAHKNGVPIDLSVWPSGNYVVAVARRAAAASNDGLCRKVRDVVRAVTAEATDVTVRDNYQIWQRCAEIFGILPVSILEAQDIALIETWVGSAFDTSLVAIELSKGLIPNLLKAADQASCTHLQKIFDILTRFETEKAKDRRSIRGLVDPYWLGEILRKHAKALGMIGGAPIVRLLASRVADFFTSFPESTWLIRPAIEENAANIRRHDLEEALVDGLRDAACEVVDNDLGTIVSELLSSPHEILFRVGLHVARKRFDTSATIVGRLIEAAWFTGGGRHELYLLLRERFAEFGADLKARALEIIAGLQTRDTRDELGAQRHQRYWLMAISSVGDPTVIQRLATFDAQLGPSTGDPHEGLLTYFESFHGPGPSPYSGTALLSLLEQGRLIAALNAFEPDGTWRGPTVRSLVKTLEDVVASAPDRFLSLSAEFASAKVPYRVGFLSGFAAAWEKGRSQRAPTLDQEAWQRLLDYADSVSTTAELNARDETSEPLTPQLTWLPGVIAELVNAGVRDDEYAFDVTLLRSAKNLLASLLARVQPVGKTSESDAVFVATNSPRGKIIEALIALALRAKRTEQEATLVEEILQNLDEALQVGDLESHTLLVAAIGQIEYLHPGWMQARLDALFSGNDCQKLEWSLRGLAYVSTSRWVHALMKAAGVYTAALPIRGKLGQAWNSLLDRMAVAYVVGDEDLIDLFWETLLTEHDYEAFRHVAWFMWTLRTDESLPKDQKQRIVAFWEHLVKRIDNARDGATQLRGNLAMLVWAMTGEDRRAEQLLSDGGAAVRSVYHDYEFAQQLCRIAPFQPTVVMSALEATIARSVPDIDFEDAYLNLLKALYAMGQVARVIRVADRLRHIPEVRTFYEEIRNS